ncbi:biliverdin-producing heme oxygenase [Frondihabitans cladoniiphilus]|uniref:Biliverdin-producing heme oxygenase n=1 Tax=Frondihabitans cladoniiphilus TaxID=715785 RepID=A0ABP8WB20_9MICO
MSEAVPPSETSLSETPLSETLRERAGSIRTESIQTGAIPVIALGTEVSPSERFMAELLTGQGTRDDYTALLAQHFFVYRALEAAAELRAGDPVAARFISPALTRLPAIREDLRFLVGDDWEARIEPLETTRRYVERIETVAATSTGGFVAHHYTRYLGDLAGCQVIRTLMQRQFGFETNGVGFWLFAGIAKPKEFKSVYRAQLDSVGWTDAERQQVLDEVAVAYRLTEDMFGGLVARSAAAA